MKPGDRVVVTAGAFAKMEAEILAIEGDTASVRVSVFGRTVEQRVPLDQLGLRADPESLRRGFEHAASLLRANTHDRWWAARAPGADPIAEHRAFEDHALAYDAAIAAELDAIDAELREMTAPPPPGWPDAQLARLGALVPQPAASTEELLQARERRARALEALRAAGETPRYVGERGTP